MGALHRKIYFIPAGCIIFILFFTIFGDKGLLRIHELKQDRKLVERRLLDAKKENERLRHEIFALRNDYRYVERVARKDLGLFYRDEIIYQFPPEKR